MKIFADHLGVKVIRVNAEERFLGTLKGVSDPEAKRKVIGKLFIDVFDEESAKIPNVQFLTQAPIYPDVIESAGSQPGKAHDIKSHQIERASYQERVCQYDKITVYAVSLNNNNIQPN